MIWIAALCFSPLLAAQENGRNATSSDEQHTDAANLSQSATVPRNRYLEQSFDIVEEFLVAGDHARAVAQLNEILSEEESSFVLRNGILHEARNYAVQLLRRASEQTFSAYQRLNSQDAENELVLAQASRDLRQLQQVSDRYPGTPAGNTAVHQRIALLVDGGHLAKAALEIESQLQKFCDAGGRQLSELESMSESLQEELLDTRREVPATDPLKGGFPSVIPNWSIDYNLPLNAIETIATGIGYLKQNGIAPLVPWNAVFSDKLVITSHATSIQARSKATGELVWERLRGDYGAKVIRNAGSPPPGEMPQANMSESAMQGVLFRVFDGSLDSHLTVHGQHVYFIEPVEFRDLPADQDSPQADSKPSVGPNRLICLDLDSGKPQWVSETIANGHARFCGPPTPYGDRLYILAEFESDQYFYLLALDPQSGELLRKTRLAKPLLPLDGEEQEPAQKPNDRRRLTQACPVTIVDGHAYCPTAAGALIAVDLGTDRVEWVYRYPRSDLLSTSQFNFFLGSRLSGYRWWSDWQAIQILTAGNYLAIISPETNQLSVLDRVAGRVVWTTHRDDGIYLAAISEANGLAVIGRTSALSFDLPTGQKQWSIPLRSPTGFGVRQGDSYLLPENQFGWTQINLVDGTKLESRFSVPTEILPDTTAQISTPRNLVAYGNETFEIGLNAIKSLRSQTSEHSTEQLNAADRLSLAIENIQLNQISELLSKATIHHPRIVTSKDAILQLIRQQADSDTYAEEINSILARLTEIFAGTIHSGDVFRARFHFLRTQADWPELAFLIAEHFASDFSDQFVTVDEHRRVRIDRWFGDELNEVIKSLDNSSRVELLDLVDQAIEVRFADDPARSGTVPKLFAHTQWSDHFAIDAEAETPDLASFLRTQLNLLEQTQADLPEVAASASLQLARNFENHNWFVYAQRWWSMVKDLPDNTSFSSGKTLAAILQEWKQTRQADEPAVALTTWPELKPVITVKQRRSSDVYFTPVPVTNYDGTTHTLLNCNIDFPSKRGIRFSGANWSRPWDAYLPNSQRTMRSNSELYQGWSLAGMMVFQVGSEVMAYSPFDVKGNRGARIIWPPRDQTIDTLGTLSNHMLRNHRIEPPRHPGFPKRPNQHINEFGFQATAVGPVRAGYFCIQQHGMLVAFETAYGNEIWRRRDLPHNAQCFGNDKIVAVHSAESQQLSLISARDGQLHKRMEFELPHESIVDSDGTSVLTVSGERGDVEGSQADAEDNETPLVLKWTDLAEPKVLWQREWPSGSFPFQLDGRWIGIMQPDQKVQLVERQTGDDVAEFTLRDKSHITHVACSVSNRDLLVAFSKPIDDYRLLNATQSNRGYRKPYINGPLYSIDRETAELRWESTLENTVLPIDQPVDLPVFVTAENRNPEGRKDGGAAGSRLRVYSRQTGEMLYETESVNPTLSNYSLYGSLDTGIVELTTSYAEIEFNYAPPVTETAPAPPEEN